MNASLPRTLAMIALACLASAGRAEDQASASRDNNVGRVRTDASEGTAKPRRWWFPFARKARVNRMRDAHAHKPQTPPAVVSGVVLASLLGGGLTLWLLLLTIRLRMRSNRVQWQARETPALLGVLFGFPAGLWMYDKLCPYSAAYNEPKE